MDKFDWSHTLSAPNDYPIRIYQATLKGLRSEDYSATFGLWGIAKGGWGRASGTVSVGPDLKAVPASLEITWLSLVENKFYTGNFDLPRDEMIRLFKEGFYLYDIKKQDTYTSIVVGMAPGGLVVVWLLGGRVETEVAMFRAEEIKIDPKTVHPSKANMFKPGYADFALTNLNLKNQKVPPGLWEAYRVKYTWRPQLILPHDCKIAETWITLYNGEKEHIFAEDPKHDDFKKRALSQELNFTWHNAVGKKYYGKSLLNEEELFKAYEQIYRNDKEQEAELVYVLNEQQDGFNIYLRSKTEEIELEKVQNVAFPASD